jgi:hypothetical protein
MRTRDDKKDGDYLSANVTCFNANVHFLKKYGECDPIGDKNSDDNLWNVIKSFDQAFDKEGSIEKALNFHRGGQKGYEDPRLFQCFEYRTGIASMYKLLTDDPTLLWDNRKIWCVIDYV